MTVGLYLKSNKSIKSGKQFNWHIGMHISVLHILKESPNRANIGVHNVTNYFPDIERYSLLKTSLSEESADTEWRKKSVKIF